MKSLIKLLFIQKMIVLLTAATQHVNSISNCVTIFSHWTIALCSKQQNCTWDSCLIITI